MLLQIRLLIPLLCHIGASSSSLSLYSVFKVRNLGLNIRDIRLFAVPLPPLAEQYRIVAEVERRLSVVSELVATVEANLKRVERLRQAILKQAFAGKLVPQDPNDRPASVLLERIRGVYGRGSSPPVHARRGDRKGTPLH